MEYKGAIFDMDGLLFDTERMYQQTWREIAEEMGICLDNGFTKAISGTNGLHMCRMIEKYYHFRDGTSIMEKCIKRMNQKLSIYVPIKKGVYEILNFFSEKGIPMAVASSSTMQQIEKNLHMAEIYDYFSAIVSGEEVKHGKPEPDIFICAAQKIGCTPQECFVFEDSENGIKAGYAAGCFTIMVPDIIEASSAIEPYCKKICQDLYQAEHEIRKLFPI